MKIKAHKKIIIVVIMVLINIVTIAYATFASNLEISSAASVKPNATTFKVGFSTQTDSIVEGQITPRVYGTGETASVATISGTTITGLHASFTEPDQYAKYRFYIKNDGAYNAIFNGLTF